MTNPIEIYTSNDGQIRLEITLQDETLWLSQMQMSHLFDTSTDNISLHLKNIFADKELAPSATIEDFSVVRQEGKRQVKRKLTHYNLDAVISVGYRVNSSRATQFRIWATRTLKQHLVEGYTLNQQRLQQRGIEIEQALGLLSSTLQNQQMINESGEAVLAVISDYARSWSLLQAYDEQSLTDSQQKQTAMQALLLLLPALSNKFEQRALCDFELFAVAN